MFIQNGIYYMGEYLHCVILDFVCSLHLANLPLGTDGRVVKASD